MHSRLNILAVATFHLFAGLAQTAQAQLSTDAGLIAYFPFKGSAVDQTVNGGTSSVFGATLTLDRFGVPNSAYAFNGTSDRITATISNIPSGTAARTLSAWVKLSTTAAGTYIPVAWGENGVNNSVFGLMAQGSPTPQWFVQHYGGGQDVNSGVAVDTNWHHIVGTFTNGVTRVYIDGALRATRAKTLNTAVSVLIIGVGVEGTTFFPGAIDEVRVYNRALTDGEVQGLFVREASPHIALRKAVRPVLDNLHVGTNYQLQLSGNLMNWTNHAAPFTATNSVVIWSEFFEVDSWQQLFFRAYQQP